MMKLVMTATVAALLAFAAGATGTPPDGMPPQASYGLCTAWGAMGGNDNPGNAPNAPPFGWLQDMAEEAEETVDEWCAQNAPHPGQGNGPPGNPGPP